MTTDPRFSNHAEWCKSLLIGGGPCNCGFTERKIHVHVAHEQPQSRAPEAVGGSVSAFSPNSADNPNPK